jgi:hypothetical protein
MWAGTLTKGLMHGWVAQFATQLEIFFTKKKWPNLGNYN